MCRTSQSRNRRRYIKVLRDRAFSTPPPPPTFLCSYNSIVFLPQLQALPQTSHYGCIGSLFLFLKAFIAFCSLLCNVLSCFFIVWISLLDENSGRVRVH